MVQQKEDIKRTAHPESGESEGAKVKSPGTDQRRAAWEKTLNSFVERFDFTPVDLKPDVHDGVPLVAGTDMPLSTILWMLSVGYRVENILKEYPGVERKQLLNALAFAAELLEE